MLKCEFNKVDLQGCSPVNLLHIFKPPFPKNTSGRLLLIQAIQRNFQLHDNRIEREEGKGVNSNVAEAK